MKIETNRRSCPGAAICLRVVSLVLQGGGALALTRPGVYGSAVRGDIHPLDRRNFHRSNQRRNHRRIRLPHGSNRLREFWTQVTPILDGLFDLDRRTPI